MVFSVALPALDRKLAIVKFVFGTRRGWWWCSVLQRSTFHGWVLDNRQEKIFAFGFYMLTRKQTSSEQFDCISSTHCFIIVVTGCCLNMKMQSWGGVYKLKF